MRSLRIEVQGLGEMRLPGEETRVTLMNQRCARVIEERTAEVEVEVDLPEVATLSLADSMWAH